MARLLNITFIINCLKYLQDHFDIFEHIHFISCTLSSHLKLKQVHLFQLSDQTVEYIFCARLKAVQLHLKNMSEICPLSLVHFLLRPWPTLELTLSLSMSFFITYPTNSFSLLGFHQILLVCLQYLSIALNLIVTIIIIKLCKNKMLEVICSLSQFFAKL